MSWGISLQRPLSWHQVTSQAIYAGLNLAAASVQALRCKPPEQKPLPIGGPPCKQVQTSSVRYALSLLRKKWPSLATLQNEPHPPVSKCTSMCSQYSALGVKVGHIRHDVSHLLSVLSSSARPCRGPPLCAAPAAAGPVLWAPRRMPSSAPPIKAPAQQCPCIDQGVHPRVVSTYCKGKSTKTGSSQLLHAHQTTWHACLLPPSAPVAFDPRSDAHAKVPARGCAAQRRGPRFTAPSACISALALRQHVPPTSRMNRRPLPGL